MGIDSVNQGLAEQKQMIVPLNDEWNKYNQELTAAKMAARDYAPDLEKLVNIFTEYNNHTTTAKINMDELNRAITEVINGDPSKLADFLKNSTIDLDALNETAAAFGWTSDQLVQGLQNLEEGLIDDAKFVDDLTKSMEAAKGAAAGMGKATKTVGSVMKSVLSTVGCTVVVTAILAALGALWKWITGLQTAAKKQRELNKAINESAASIESKSLIAFKELARRYKEIGDTAEEKTKFLEQFKKKIEETGLAITTIKDADEAFINNTGAYIQALKDRAKAQAIENEAVRIYEEYLNKVSEIKADAEDLTFWQRAGVAWMRSEGAILPDNWEGQLMADNLRKANEEVKKETEAMEATLNKLFDEMFTMEQQSEPYFEQVVEEVKTVTETTTSAKENELEMLAKYYKDARRLFMDARTRELDEVQEKYDEQIALAIKHNQDTTLLEQAKQREIDNIIKKYNDERLAQLQADAERQYQVIQEQINRIRMMNDTSNLGEPQEQSYTTEYNQGFGKAFMAGSKFFYQSGEDVKNQYDAQVEYNNKLYELTQSRIEQENELLNKQLEIEGITADRRLEIERTLRENEMALSDAAIKNEADNIAAYKSLQEKKNQATQSTLSVASDVFGAMATLAGEETKAGKAFAVTQAIIDTYSAANSAYASMAGVPYVGPALGIAAAAAAIASGIANVKTILSTNVSSDVNSVSLSTGAVATPPALTTPPIEYTRNLLGDKETDELNKATKVYVLESDITAVQNKVKVTEDNASF